jgi:hypothetical protein
VLVISFPHNPTAVVDPTSCNVVDFVASAMVGARLRTRMSVSTVTPPSILQAEGAKDCAVELY